MEVIKSVKFKYHGDFSELFRDFREMVEFCVDRALELDITSYAKLRKAVYEGMGAKMASEIPYLLLPLSM